MQYFNIILLVQMYIIIKNVGSSVFFTQVCVFLYSYIDLVLQTKAVAYLFINIIYGSTVME